MDQLLGQKRISREAFFFLIKIVFFFKITLLCLRSGLVSEIGHELNRM